MMHSNSKERGMIFNAEMVRAILSGQKTQTRRVMKSQPYPSKTREGDYWFSCNKVRSMVHVSDFISGNSVIPDVHEFFSTCCPFGAVGDRIWVRETFGDCGARLVYRADSDDGASCAVKRWTPSIHMPRWASRILLEITNVRVERLNDISEQDAIAEGIERYNDDGTVYYGPYGKGDCRPERAFSDLWKSIYGDENWQANPWVWVIEFKRVQEQSND